MGLDCDKYNDFSDEENCENFGKILFNFLWRHVEFSKIKIAT